MLLNDNYFNWLRLYRITKTQVRGFFIYINSLFPAHTLPFTENVDLINLLVFDYSHCIYIQLLLFIDHPLC